MLIASHRHTAADLEAWARLERADMILGSMRRLAKLEADAMREIQSFADGDDRAFYVSVSWGKDSVVVAHLAIRALGPSVRVAWFPAGLVENPDNAIVRDAFLRAHACDYVEVDASGEEWSDVDGHDGAQAAFERVASSLAPRYVSGVRAEESGLRKMRMRGHGLSSVNTCAPIGWWTSDDVFAYLARHDLPIHPAYACTMGGSYDRRHIRVSTIAGYRGAHRGRAEWERRYYRDEIATIERSDPRRSSPF